MKKILIAVLCVLLVIASSIVFTACRQAERVSYNISKEADNFNVLRRLTVINARTDKPVFELVAYFSLSNSEYNELEITCQTGPSQYTKHYVYLNDWTIYVVEDLSGTEVSPYYYEINFLPEMIWPFGVTDTDTYGEPREYPDEEPNEPSQDEETIEDAE